MLGIFLSDALHTYANGVALGRGHEKRWREEDQLMEIMNVSLHPGFVQTVT